MRAGLWPTAVFLLVAFPTVGPFPPISGPPVPAYFRPARSRPFPAHPFPPISGPPFPAYFRPARCPPAPRPHPRCLAHCALRLTCISRSARCSDVVRSDDLSAWTRIAAFGLSASYSLRPSRLIPSHPLAPEGCVSVCAISLIVLFLALASLAY